MMVMSCSSAGMTKPASTMPIAARPDIRVRPARNHLVTPTKRFQENKVFDRPCLVRSDQRCGLAPSDARIIAAVAPPMVDAHARRR
jgi:hypothetical protein